MVKCLATKHIIDVSTSGETATMTPEELIHYRITSMSLSLVKADGLFHKPLKSLFMTLLNMESASPPDKYHVLIEVGMAWMTCTTSKTWS